MNIAELLTLYVYLFKLMSYAYPMQFLIFRQKCATAKSVKYGTTKITTAFVLQMEQSDFTMQ